jgi:hypothetical protein
VCCGPEKVRLQIQAKRIKEKQIEGKCGPWAHGWPAPTLVYVKFRYYLWLSELLFLCDREQIPYSPAVSLFLGGLGFPTGIQGPAHPHVQQEQLCV